MKSLHEQLSDLYKQRENAAIKVFTLGNFRVQRQEEEVDAKEWGRDTAIQLFQFLVTARERHSLHKEQIIDRIFPEADMKKGESTFKVALHGVNKALEPNRPGRTEPTFVIRQGITYRLNLEKIWIDSDAVEKFIGIGNQAMESDTALAEVAYREALDLYHGIYLPNRIYEDWSSTERERLQVLSLGAFVTLSELILEKNPAESIRIAHLALKIDPTWEDAYRVQMQAYLNSGNRPAAIKTYRICVRVLEEEFGLDPLPETEQLYRKITGK